MYVHAYTCIYDEYMRIQKDKKDIKYSCYGGMHIQVCVCCCVYALTCTCMKMHQENATGRSLLVMCWRYACICMLAHSHVFKYVNLCVSGCVCVMLMCVYVGVIVSEEGSKYGYVRTICIH